MRTLLYHTNALFSGTWTLFFSLFLMLLGAGLQSSLLGIRGSDEGFSTLTLSVIATSYYIGYFGGSFVIPHLLKRVGYIRVFAALVAVASVAAVAYAMFIEQYSWFAMRLMTGFCFAGIYMTVESWLNSQTYNENRAKVLSMYVIITFVGMSVGQILLNIGDINGYFLFALSSVIISLASVPLLLTARPAPLVEESTATLSILKLFKRSPLGVFSSFFVNFMNGGVVAMAAIYAKSIDIPTDKISLFIASAFIGVIILQFPIGFISDRLDRRRVIITVNFLAVVVAFIAMNTNDINYLIFWFGLLGGLTLPLYAVSIAYINDRLEPEEVLPATSALVKISGIGNMFAPILIGYIMVKYGEQWFFGCVGIAAMLIVLFGLYRMTISDDIDVEEQSEYIPFGVDATAATLSLAHESVQMEFDFGEEHRRPPEAMFNREDDKENI